MGQIVPPASAALCGSHVRLSLSKPTKPFGLSLSKPFDKLRANGGCSSGQT